MNILYPAQVGAQVLSLIVYASIAAWYAVPWLRAQSRSQALIALLWVHVFRYVALQVYSAQKTGFPISDAGATDIVIGDVGGAVMAFVAIVLLRHGSRLAVPLAWILVAITAFDTVQNIRGGIAENLMGAASGVTWMILVYFVPAVVISTVLLGWQLAARRREAFPTHIERGPNLPDAAGYVPQPR